jgi:hypothetical protein
VRVSEARIHNPGPGCEGELHELNGPQSLEDWYEGSVLALAMNAVAAEYVREIGTTS